MKIITHKQIVDLKLEPCKMYDWIVESFLSKNQSILPNKISMTQPNNVFYNVMPSLNKKLQRGGVKVVTRVPGRIPSLDAQIYLYSMQDAKLISILDANYITAMRTGAVTALSIELYAKDDFETIALMGLGVTASAIMKMLEYTLEGKQIKFKLYNHNNQAPTFINNHKSCENFSFQVCNSYEDLIKESDIVISSITYANRDFTKFNWFKKGVLLLPVHVMGFENIDYLFDKVFVDDPSHLRHMKNYNKFTYVREMSEVLERNCKGRENSKERIIAYNVGLSIHDITFASKIYDEFKGYECIQVNLESPSEKYWL